MIWDGEKKLNYLVASFNTGDFRWGNYQTPTQNPKGLSFGGKMSVYSVEALILSLGVSTVETS